MTVLIRVLLLAAAVSALAAAPASAWKGWLESQVIPIARAQDPAVAANLEQVEARVLRARQALPGLVEEARSAGVSPELLDLYVRATQPKR